MAVVEPFRALRYDERRAGPLDSLLAPPYDVIGPAEREALRARSPFNVVRLTLPDSEAEAARLLDDWRREGVLVQEEEPSFWALAQDYTGPDGVPRTREGLVAAVRVEPYAAGAVLPHERTHRGPKEGRLRLLRAVRTQLEPILLLYDAAPAFELPAREPDVEAAGARLWRLAGGGVSAALSGHQLLIADGHHRYETALAFHEEDGRPESAFVLAVLVSTADEGLTIFPTHRVFGRRPDSPLLEGSEPFPGAPASALAELERLPRETPAVALYEAGGTRIRRSDQRMLDVELVDRLGHDEIAYTPDWDDAVGRVDSGEAALAVGLRPTRIEDVFAVARRGDVMPQKSTYFFPKLLSGLVLQPL
ncbi:MAG: DUF1015 domain-containing protein [Actinobacteria bacterium]|nr:DUF1015 domain-containing protein [Actinomycetota bacterium]